MNPACSNPQKEHYSGVAAGSKPAECCLAGAADHASFKQTIYLATLFRV